MDRRAFLQAGLVGGVAVGFGPGFWRRAYAEPALLGPGPYGGLAPPDANGIQLPAGFTSRLVATSGQPVGPRRYMWHPEPDGGATFAMDDGGWVYVSNSEVTPGGAGALRFDAAGAVVDAYRILDGTDNNCAGGATPWGTWLSCEETLFGQVWECRVDGPGQGVVRPAMGTFAHEAVAVDPVRRQLYLTEDTPDGKLYRFTPDAYPDLDAGRLQAVAVDDGAVTWVDVEPALTVATSRLLPELSLLTRFDGGEGIWYDRDTVYFTTKGDNRVWALDCAHQRLEIIYDDDFYPDAPLTGVDNITVSPAGDLFVAEDGGNMELVILSEEGPGAPRQVTPFLRVLGQDDSELAGPAFDPSGTRLYFSSQRGGPDRGLTYEITGPFRSQPAASPGGAGPTAAGAGAQPAPEASGVGGPSPSQPGPAAPPADLPAAGTGPSSPSPDAVPAGIAPPRSSLPRTGASGSLGLGAAAAAAAAAATWRLRHPVSAPEPSSGAPPDRSGQP